MLETASHNLLVVGLEETRPEPCTLVIFGGGGDLAKRKLLPAVYNLVLDGVFPTNFAVLGFGRRDLRDEDYQAFAREGVEEYSRRPVDANSWADYERSLFFLQGSFDDAKAFQTLKKRLEEIESVRGIPGNRVFYLSISPTLIETCVTQLKSAGLINPPGSARPFSRVIVEKPIGRDLESARQINATLARVLDERQIFRIDHYLGKETVQNILVMRFGNSIFEPLWNQKYIDHVQITVAEADGVGTRADYYEQAGALRDMVQNHILQLLSLTAMEPPWAMTADVVRDNKLDVLNCLRPVEDCVKCVVRAQYTAGEHEDTDLLPGYRREENVKPDSTTETYVAIKAFVDNWRWAGVPFYIRTGKRLPKRASEIAVQFKDVPPILFNVDPRDPIEPNVLALRIQPNEGFSLRVATKLPGPKVRVDPVKMDFQYDTTFEKQSPEAYERLLVDVMAGDATLFMRRDEVEASWTWITNILQAWEQSGTRWLPEYAAGSWGPVEADKLIQAEGRKWQPL